MTDRDENGRFKKGHTVKSPGRPVRARDEEYQAILYEVVPLEKWRKILEAQVKRAERGDIQAFNALANRIMPLITKQEVSGSEGEPLKIIFEYVGDTNEES